MRRARILVSDAEIPAALAVTRSLGRAGHRVTVMAHARLAAAAGSRHRQGVVTVPDAIRDPDGWTASLLRAAPRYDVFLPVSDTALLLAQRVRVELDRHLLTGLPEGGALDALLEKTRVLERAEALGVPVLPRRRGDEIPGTPLPAVVKPARSRALGYRGVRSATARVVGDAVALVRESERLSRAGLGAYAEPWVPGSGRGIFLLLHRGRVLARFAHRRVREASPLGGPSAVCESVALDPDLVSHAELLARDLGAEGPFMAEFRGEGDDHVLLEVNARYWGSLALAIAAGVDFPALHLRALLGDPAERPPEYRTGVRCRNLAFDLRHAARTLRGRPRGLPLPWPGRLRTLCRLVAGPWRGLAHEARDPAPGRALAVGLARWVVRRG